MIGNGHVGDLAGPYAVGACEPAEAIAVAEHVSTCPDCAAEIDTLSRTAEWIGVTAAQPPPPRLRGRVLAAALAARPAREKPARPPHAKPTGAPSAMPADAPGDAPADALGDAPADAPGDAPADAPGDAPADHIGDAYRAQVAELDRLLADLTPEQWQRPSQPHPTVRDLVLHLASNDHPVAEAVGVRGSTPEDVRLRWRTQAEAVLDAVGRGLPDVEVPLAGRRPVRRPMRDALIQRGFETWIHAEDVRAVLSLPPRPPGRRQISDIVGLALALLPAAMEAGGQTRAVRLVLDGRAHVVGRGAVVAEVSMTAERFCRLVAGRLAPAATNAEVGGDPIAAVDLLTVAATMGCD